VIVLLKINVFNCNKIVGVVSPIKYKQPEARVVCLNEVNVNFANQAKYLCLHDSLKDDNGTQKQVKPFYCAEMACLISAPLQLKNSYFVLYFVLVACQCIPIKSGAGRPIATGGIQKQCHPNCFVHPQIFAKKNESSWYC